jgi:excinuclease UvrABC ATPase subunit
VSIDKLVVRGAREHNLKDVSIELPRDALIVFTGLSGSGKSSLAFDTIFAEGQRRYVESLSAYARQFLGQMDTYIRSLISSSISEMSLESVNGEMVLSCTDKEMKIR